MANSSTRWVQQKHKNGCGIACLAMILKTTYDEADTLFSIFNGEGILVAQMDELLACYGYAIARISKKTYLRGYKEVPRDNWPVTPFAPIHLCLVRVSKRAKIDHFIIMLKDGTILDPDNKDKKSLSDYHDVHHIAGITKIRSFDGR